MLEVQPYHDPDAKPPSETSNTLKNQNCLLKGIDVLVTLKSNLES